jgi:hypothetical protein
MEMGKQGSKSSTIAESLDRTLELRTGIMLAIAAAFNMLSRADIFLNIAVSALLVTGAVGIIRRRPWGPRMGVISSAVAVGYTVYEMLFFLYVLPPELGARVAQLAAMFIIPMDIICLIALSTSWKLGRALITD